MFYVAVLTPTAGNVKMDYAQSLARMVLHFCTQKVDPESPEQGMILAAQRSFSTSCNREMLIDMILPNKEITHVLFVDDDMGFEEDTLHLMASRNQDILCANYPKKKFPIEFITIGLDGKELASHRESIGLEEAQQGGFGFALIKREVFERLPKPWFPVLYNSTLNVYSSDDYYFSRMARLSGYKIMIDHDASHKVWHMGDFKFSTQ